MTIAGKKMSGFFYPFQKPRLYKVTSVLTSSLSQLSPLSVARSARVSLSRKPSDNTSDDGPPSRAILISLSMASVSSVQPKRNLIDYSIHDSILSSTSTVSKKHTHWFEANTHESYLKRSKNGIKVKALKQE